MRSNGQRFEEAYNRIDTLLRRKLHKDRREPFAQVVSAAAGADATVRNYRFDLLAYGDLRNAIVHERGHAPLLIADPRVDVVRRIEEISERLSRPKTLKSIRRHAPIHFFAVADPLPKVLAYMRKYDFS